MAAAAFVTSIPLLGIEWPRHFDRATLKGLSALLYAALLPSLIAQIFYMRGVELIGPGRAGVYVNLVPAFGALLAVVLLGENFAPYHAVALVLSCSALASPSEAPRRRRRRESPPRLKPASSAQDLKPGVGSRSKRASPRGAERGACATH